jgi:hypothetical protein
MATGGRLRVVFASGPPLTWDAGAAQVPVLWDDSAPLLVSEYDECLLRLLSQSAPGPKPPAAKILAGTKRAEYLPAIEQACATAKQGPPDEICAAAAGLKADSARTTQPAFALAARSGGVAAARASRA